MTKPAHQKNPATVVWGADLEKDHFLIVPKVLFRLGRFGDANAKRLKPRHLLLLLALAAKKFKTEGIRAYWVELSEDLYVSKETVRKWAYEVRKLGFLQIRQNRGRDRERDRPGFRNESNSFTFAPLIESLEAAKKSYQAERKKRERGRE
ncbi:MAG: hypothetical protein U1D55_18175 [Phycisphaerae bacterium]